MNGILFKACGVAGISLALLLTLKGMKSDTAMFVRVALSISALAAVVGVISPALNFARVQLVASDTTAYGETMLKGLGITYLTFICSSVCRDCGEASVASGVEAVGKAELILLSLPFLRQILQVMEELLGA